MPNHSHNRSQLVHTIQKHTFTTKFAVVRLSSHIDTSLVQCFREQAATLATACDVQNLFTLSLIVNQTQFKSRYVRSTPKQPLSRLTEEPITYKCPQCKLVQSGNALVHQRVDPRALISIRVVPAVLADPERTPHQTMRRKRSTHEAARPA